MYPPLLLESCSHLSLEAKKETAKKKKETCTTKLLETLGTPVSPFRTIRTRDRRKYRRKVEVRRFTALFVFLGCTEGPSPPPPSLSPSLPSSPLSDDKIYTQKLHAKWAQPRAGEHVCTRVYGNEIDGTVFEDAVSPSFETFRQIVGRKYRYATVCVYISRGASFLPDRAKKGTRKFFDRIVIEIGLEKNFEWKFRIRRWIG